ncbi:MAG: glucose/arabinose dehydrogenase [Rhodothermales bacterium]
MLAFKLSHPPTPFAMNYRMHQSAHRLVETTGQPRGRGQVQYLHDGQTDYRITIHLQNAGSHIPRGYQLETIPPPKLPAGYSFEAAGIDFAPDGTLYVSTRTVGVWSYRDGKWAQFADGLYDALGLRVRQDGVYVMQKPELTRLVDDDADGVADRYDSIAAGFRFSGNYHEFAYGPRFDRAGNAFLALNLAAGTGHKVSQSDGIQMTTPLGFRGCVMRVSPDGQLTPHAYGFRSPAGIGINGEDELFVTDNQGDWVPSSYLIHVRPGQFHGHPASLLDTAQYGGGAPLTAHTVYPIPSKVPAVDEADFRQRRLPPTVWLPHEEYANSPGNPEFCETASFGPFKDQLFIGDVTKKSILRVQLERIGGEYQGAVFHFVRPLPGGGFRLKFAPDGALYIGELARGWGSGMAGVQRLTWDGKTPPFEIHSARLASDGFRVHFTKPLAASPKPADLEVYSFRYNYWQLYGSERIDNTQLQPTALALSPDQRILNLRLPNLQPGFIYSVRFKNLASHDGTPLVNNSFCYTLNRLQEAKK